MLVQGVLTVRRKQKELARKVVKNKKLAVVASNISEDDQKAIAIRESEFRRGLVLAPNVPKTFVQNHIALNFS